MIRYLQYGLIGLLLIAGMSCNDDAAEPESSPPVQQAAAEGALPEPDSTTAARFEAVMNDARQENLHERPIGEVTQALGEHFVGSPYIIGPLEFEDGQERLVCRLDGFDCFTFVESMLAIARGVVQQDYTYEGYAHRVRQQRYRQGEVQGYCSRIHYFSEWIQRNEERGLVRDITHELGGQQLDKILNFMSTHRESYPRLADDSTYQCIQEMEAQLTDMEIYYIPQDSIRAVYDQLQAGDLIATAAGIEGLDVTHTGMVYASEEGQGKGLLHASTSGGVKVSPDLQNYVQNIKAQIGIVVARPVSPEGTQPLQSEAH